jgi:hypothetical protein
LFWTHLHIATRTKAYAGGGTRSSLILRKLLLPAASGLFVRCGSPPDDPTKASNTHCSLELLTPFRGLYKVSWRALAGAAAGSAREALPQRVLPLLSSGARRKTIAAELDPVGGRGPVIWDAMDTPAISGNAAESKRLTAALRAR